MKRRYVPVRLPEEVLARVKKEAGKRGLSVSETIGILIAKSFDSDSGSGPGIDSESVQKEIESALRSGFDPIRKMIADLRAEVARLPDVLKIILTGKLDLPGIGDSFEKGTEIHPEAVRFLAEKVARTNALLNGVSAKIDLADHTKRTAQAEAVAQSEIKKLFGG